MAESLRQEDVLESVLKRQKEWMRKMEEMSEERLTNAVYAEEMQGKTPRARLQKDRHWQRTA